MLDARRVFNDQCYKMRMSEHQKSGIVQLWENDKLMDEKDLGVSKIGKVKAAKETKSQKQPKALKVDKPSAASKESFSDNGVDSKKVGLFMPDRCTRGF
jgi:hypothetical protein